MAVLARLKSYMEPLILLFASIVYLGITLAQNPFKPFTSLSEFRSKWFSNMWRLIGPKMAATPYQRPYIRDLLSRAKGTVLELGPGTGDQAVHFRPLQITHLYGAEPNAFLHDKLRENSLAVGLNNYTVLECGAEPLGLVEALRRAGLVAAMGNRLPPDGIFDTIVSVKSLCSADPKQMQATISVLQSLLKPGGEFIFFEHVHNDNDFITRVFVWVVGLIWPYCMGNCHLNSKVDKIVLQQGGWDRKEIRTIDEFQGYEAIRYVRGIARKPPM